MDNIILVKPNLSHKSEFLSFKNEVVLDDNEFCSLDSVKNANNYEEWLSEIKKIESNLILLKGFSPSIFYFVIDKERNKIIGAADLRQILTLKLKKYGGHIAYYIIKSERKKGYGTKVLSLAIQKYKEQGKRKILIACNKKNVASANVIKNNGGILSSETAINDKVTQKYWVYL